MKLRNKNSHSVSDISSTEIQTKPSVFILLGGFLGAGKTTCLLHLAEWLRLKGLRPGIITNDQGIGLVDTASAMEKWEAVSQITGGCFCCRNGELMAALTLMERTFRPDVFIAEPVGSCTDLVATILLPLQQVYKSHLRRAPLSVILDARRAHQHYFSTRGMGPGVGFSKDVRYIYLKQMEEAEVLVLNKMELLSPAQLKKLVGRLQLDFPGKTVHAVSASSGRGLDEWFTQIMETESSPGTLMDVDYKRYGEGEALMGWLNGKVEVKSRNDETFDGNDLLLQLAQGIQEDMEKEGVEIGHFKMAMTIPGSRDLAVVNVVSNGEAAEFSRRLSRTLGSGELLINLRAEAAPEVLDRIVTNHVTEVAREFPLRWIEKAAFRPGQPNPTHRAVLIDSPQAE